MRPALTPAAIEAVRKDLTEVATRLYVEGGSEALSLRKVAHAARISRGTPYTYFKNKQDIIDSIRAAGFDRLTERCRISLTGKSDCRAQMRQLGWEVVHFACDEPAIYDLMFSQPVFHGEVSPTIADAVARFREVSRPPLDNAIRQGFVHGDPDVLRRLTWAAFHGLVALYLQGHVESRRQLVSDFEHMNHIIGHGILVAPPPATASLSRTVKLSKKKRKK